MSEESEERHKRKLRSSQVLYYAGGYTVSKAAAWDHISPNERFIVKDAAGEVLSRHPTVVDAKIELNRLVGLAPKSSDEAQCLDLAIVVEFGTRSAGQKKIKTVRAPQVRSKKVSIPGSDFEVVTGQEVFFEVVNNAGRHFEVVVRPCPT